MKPIIISIRPQWSRLIRSGAKTIELRRRFPLLSEGSIAYLYESSPTCGLIALLRISAVHEMKVDDLWRVHGKDSCVPEHEFAKYFERRKIGYGIKISECHTLPNFLSLHDLRMKFAFTAPQSWAYAPSSLLANLGASA